MANPATLWARTFVAALARAGLRAVCVAPGSRSTPLVLAFARQEGIAVYSHLDERSAAFFALGMALAQDAPVALLCSSGTAAANLFPAIIEANMARVPLLVLTADRPPELRHSGANQTIDQVKLYGDYVLWAVDCALPEANPSALALRNLRTLAARALAVANGLRKGVVHINMPFRKPLEPDADDEFAERESQEVSGTWTGATPSPDLQNEALSELSARIGQYSEGLIVCGPGCTREFLAKSVLAFAHHRGWPLLCDPLSGLRYQGASFVACADTILAARPAAAPRPDIVLRLGAIPTSLAVNAWLDAQRPQVQIQLSPAGVWADDSHRTTHFLQAGAEALDAICRAIPAQTDCTLGAQWWAQAEALTRASLNTSLASGAWFDGAVVGELPGLLPDGAALFVGNSLPVRLLDQFGLPQGRGLRVFANRGASGIDGNLSTAFGIGMARADEPLVALIGDITFYHDMNGLLALHRLGLTPTIVLLNNNGGGIFHRLPVHELEPEFTEYFLTPHDLDFSHAARLYNLEHVRVNDRAAFRAAFACCIESGRAQIIEVSTNARADLKRRADILEDVGLQLDGMAGKLA